ncbi:MAG: phage shock protein C [Paraglaciecola sp.]|jgi:phage shock protein C
MNKAKNLYRDPEKGKIAGVCAGLSDYFGVELWLVRIIVLSAFFLTAGTFVVVSYVAAWFILDKKHGTTEKHDIFKHHRNSPASPCKGWKNSAGDEEEKINVKSKVWQAGEPPKQAFHDITERFSRNESRLRKVETYVTSSEFQLNREINSL